MTTLVDARGCLTEAGLAALAAAPAGQAPGDAAAHLAGCARCQRRFLARAAREEGGISAVPGQAVAPPLWRTGVVMLAALLLLVVAMVGMRMFAG